MFCFYLSQNYWKIKVNSTKNPILVLVITCLLKIMRNYYTQNVKLFGSKSVKPLGSSSAQSKCNCKCDCYEHYKTQYITNTQIESPVESPVKTRGKRAEAFTKAFKNIKVIGNGYRKANEVEKCLNEKREKREKPRKWLNTILKCTCDQSVASVSQRGVPTNIIKISCKTDAKNQQNASIDWSTSSSSDEQSACTCSPSCHSATSSLTDSLQTSSLLISVGLARFTEDISLDYEVSLHCILTIDYCVLSVRLHQLTVSSVQTFLSALLFFIHSIAVQTHRHWP